MNAQTPEAEQGTHSRRWLALAVLALPTLILAMDQNVLYLSLPNLAEDLGASSAQQLWIMDVYGLMVAAMLIPFGVLGDRIGRVRILLIGAVAFAALSLVAAFSPTPEAIIGARALLGIAGATLMPATLGVISELFPQAEERAKAVGIWMMCFMVGTIIGPIVGGVLLNWFWWGSAFLVGIPAMVVLLITAPRLLPRSVPNERAGSIDQPSIALIIVAMLLVVFGVKRVGQGQADGIAMLTLAGGIASAAMFLRRQRRISNPIVQLELFRSRRFTAALFIMFFGAVVIGGSYLHFAQYLQLVSDLTPLSAGMWMLPPALAFAISSLTAAALAQRFGAARTLAVGLVISALGFVVMSMASSSGDLTSPVLGFSLVYLGFGPGAVLGTDLIVGSAPQRHAGGASALSETSTELGMSMGIALLGSLGLVAYRSKVSSLESALEPSAWGQVQEGVTSAHDAAAGLPDQLAGTVVLTSQQAFATSLQWVGIAAAAISVLLAVAAAVLLREEAQPEASDEPELAAQEAQ